MNELTDMHLLLREHGYEPRVAGPESWAWKHPYRDGYILTWTSHTYDVKPTALWKEFTTAQMAMSSVATREARWLESRLRELA